MSFDSIEVSEFGNHPIETYEFQRGPTFFRYTSSDESFFPTAGLEFPAIQIKRSRILGTQDIGKTSLKITISRRADVLNQFIATSPTDIITIKVTRFHAGDPLNSAIIFNGRIVNVKFLENEAEITCQPIFSALKRPGLRRAYQTACPHVLYGTACLANKSLFNVDAVLTDVSGNLITSPDLIVSINPTFDAAHFTGGFVEFVNNNNTDRRFITDFNNVSGTLTLNLPFSDLVSGNTVKAFAGCNHTTEVCDGKFINLVNYGGFPFIPQKNPMDGTSIF
ncbi:MAG: phage BR0599 family protein [Alteromonadaceae bacterium]|nr:phage BR0599 family protein [Alteromonadaceae bacterium]